MKATEEPDSAMNMLSYAKHYAALGWHVFPVSKETKFPVTKHGVKDATIDERILKFHFEEKDDEVNIAVAVGPSGFGVLDIDPRNGGDHRLDILEQQHGKLPETLTQNTGGGGKHFLFRVPVGKKIKLRLGKEMAEPGEETGIDGLNGNKYFIVEPSIHNKTGKPYEWQDFDPFDDQPEIAEAPAWILEDEQAESAAPAKILNTSGFLPPERVADLRSALSFIPCDDYHVWIQVGQALHSTEAANAFGVWDEWSQKSDKYNPSETTKKWNSFRHTGGLNVESIFAWAESEYGWANPAKYKSAKQEELQALVDEKGKLQNYETVEAEALQYRPIPVKELQGLCQWMQGQLSTYHLHATQTAVLSLASLMVTRRYKTPCNQTSNLYLSIACESTGYIQPLKTLCQNFLSEAGKRQFIRASRINTEQVLTRALLRSPNLHYVADDWGYMLNLARRQPSGVMQHVLADIVEVYSQNIRFIDEDGQFKKGSDAEMIHAPGLCFLAMISEDKLPLMLNSVELGRGALQQFIMTESGDMIINDAPEVLPVPANVIEKIQQLQPTPAAGDLKNLNGATLPVDPKVMAWAPQVRTTVTQFEADYRELITDPRLYPLASGARISLYRLILTLAAWDRPDEPIATQAIVEWSGWYIKQWLKKTIERMALIFGDDDDRPDVYQKVLERIAKAGAEGIKERDLRNSCKPFRALTKEKRDELISMLLDDEAVRQIDTVGKNNQKGSKYVYAQFTREVKRDV